MSSEEIIKLSAAEQHEAIINKQIKAEELLDALYSHIEKENEEIGAFNSLTKEIAYDTAKTVDEKVEKAEYSIFSSTFPAKMLTKNLTVQFF